MNEKDNAIVAAWFEANKTLLETSYVAGVQPWQQSGFGLHTKRSYECWEALRKPIADCMTAVGTFLDIGCANGYLIECIIRWTQERGLLIDAYGLDISEKLAALARQRLPDNAQHIFVGNAWNWQPPRTFDYVHTELEYVPAALRNQYVHRLLNDYIHANGCLLISQYRGRSMDSAGNISTTPDGPLTIDKRLSDAGFAVEAVKSGYWEGVEKTRVVVVRKHVLRESLESLLETVEVMRDAELMTAFHQGVQELAEGKGRPWEDVEKDLGL